MSIFSHEKKYTNKLGRSSYNVEDDGKVQISIDRELHNFFQDKVLAHQANKLQHKHKPDGPQGRVKSTDLHWRARDDRFKPCLDGFEGAPRMNIAILIVGSRGDVQPFIALGKVLQSPPYSHRVRICTHSNFKDFVEENGFEFYSIGGDPEKLMSFMVRNPGVIPSMDSIKAGDVGSRRADIAEMLQGCWRACTEAGDGISPVSPPKNVAGSKNIILSMPSPFVADAIISNPPAYAHIHIAEKLAIPLHMMFTMPWSPTTAFSHPLANVKAHDADAKISNYISFARMELLTWEGLHDLINKFREKTLGLDPVHPAWGHTLLPSLKVPFTYCWSPALIPKPQDWGSHISVSGFFFLPAQETFKPDQDLLDFLDAGPPPVYIGFGSIVVEEPSRLTTMVLEAVKATGVRALVSKGWGHLGGDDVPDNIFLLGNVPHDWLFPRCSAVCHHGGAGTTAIGIALGLPTVIVPFFGDQSWWGDMVHRAGAGPQPVPYKELTAARLAENIKVALEPGKKERAKELSERVKNETGQATAAKLFQNTTQMQKINCFLCPDRVAVWRVKRTNIRLSCLAATILLKHGQLQPECLKLARNKRWLVEQGAQDPIVGLLGAVGTTMVSYINDFSQFGNDLSSASGNESSLGTHSGTAQISNENSRKRGATKATARLAASLGKHTIHIPVAIMYNLANGFHNAPWHLFNDPTVRVRNDIVGLGSGLVVGSKELCFGLYDAVTGVATQPVRGYRQARQDGSGSGILGLVQGVGCGLGGFFLKTGAAVVALPGYGLKGLEKEVQNLFISNGEAEDRRLMEEFDHARDGDRDITLADARKATAVLWNEVKGNAISAKIRQRRSWQGVQELFQLSRQPEQLAKIEQDVLDSWASLNVPSKFTLKK